jgi:hypothetical protein
MSNEGVWTRGESFKKFMDMEVEYKGQNKRVWNYGEPLIKLVDQKTNSKN